MSRIGSRWDSAEVSPPDFGGAAAALRSGLPLPTASTEGATGGAATGEGVTGDEATGEGATGVASEAVTGATTGAASLATLGGSAVFNSPLKRLESTISTSDSSHLAGWVTDTTDGTAYLPPSLP